MADTPQKVEVEAELDASQTVRGARAAAAALTNVINQAQELERVTRSIFSGQGNLPRQLEAFTKTIQQVQNLPAQISRAQQSARTLATGGPLAGFQNAALQATISNIRTDPALQLQKIEKETNKVLEARAEIFRRVRSAMPTESSAMHIAGAYRQVLSSLGDMPAKGTQAYMNWIAKTRSEARRFEADWTKNQAEELANRGRAAARMTAQTLETELKLRRQHQREINRLMRQDMGAIMLGQTAEERAANAQGTVNRLQSYAGRRGMTGIDTTQLMRMYSEAEDRRTVRDTLAERNNTADARRARVERSIQNRRDFMNYNGGAESFSSRLSFTRDFAAQAALLGAFSYAGTTTVDLQAKLKNLQAITQSTTAEMQQLATTVFDVGQKSKFSTSEIAEAATVMAQAGYSANQIKEALPSIANLATGAGASLEDAVNIVTSVLSVYDMSIERSADVSNMLTQALNGSKLSLDQLSLGVQYAGNIAADSGVSFEEMTSALGAMANAGIKSGSTLGTGLRALIQELENPSQKFIQQLQTVGLTTADVDVKAVGLAGALQTLRQAGFDSGAAMNTFEIRAASAFSALSNNIGTMEQLQADLVGTKAATEAAAVNMDSLAAQAQVLGNSLTQLTSVVGAPFMAMIQALIEGLNGLLQLMIAASPATQLLATALLSLMTVNILSWVGRLLVGLTGMNTALSALNLGAVRAALATGSLSAAMGAAATGVRAFTAALATNPLTWWTVALTLATEAFFGFQAAQAQAAAKADEYRTKANAARAETDKYNDRMSEITTTIETLIARHAILNTNTTLAGQAADQARIKFGDWGLQLLSLIHI